MPTNDELRMRRQVRTLLEKVRAIETELEQMVGSPGEELEWWDRRCRVLVEVLNRGGIVTSTEWSDIGRELGYDRRGLGGFFTGGNPTMTPIAGGRHALTEVGRRDAEEYLNEHSEFRRTDLTATASSHPE